MNIDEVTAKQSQEIKELKEEIKELKEEIKELKKRDDRGYYEFIMRD